MNSPDKNKFLILSNHPSFCDSLMRYYRIVYGRETEICAFDINEFNNKKNIKCYKYIIIELNPFISEPYPVDEYSGHHKLNPVESWLNIIYDLSITKIIFSVFALDELGKTFNLPEYLFSYDGFFFFKIPNNLKEALCPVKNKSQM